MTQNNSEILTESRIARSGAMSKYSDEQALDLLNKAKGLVMALWNGKSVAITEQVAEFYNVPQVTVRSLVKTYKDEFESDGLQVLRSKGVREVSCLFQLTSKTPNITIWTPRAALRLGMLLRDSEVAKQVRTLLLDIVEAVPRVAPKPNPPALDGVVNAVSICERLLKQAGVDEGLVASFALTQYAKYDLSQSEIYEQAKKALAGTTEIPEAPLTPTELGKRIAQRLGLDKVPSARTVNLALINVGLQVAERSTSSSGKEKIVYHLTEAGKTHGKTVMDTAQGHGKTVFHVRWFESVLPVLEGAIASELLIV